MCIIITGSHGCTVSGSDESRCYPYGNVSATDTTGYSGIADAGINHPGMKGCIQLNNAKPVYRDTIPTVSL